MASCLLRCFLVVRNGKWFPLLPFDMHKDTDAELKYIMYNSDYWLNLHNLWVRWPTREMDGLSKWYYLVQFAFWLQQIVVVNIEMWRNDHDQMLAHHVVTSALIFTSYGYHQTKVGNVILCLMDSVDLFLPVSICLLSQTYRLR